MMEGFRDGPVKVLFRFGSNVKDENLVKVLFFFLQNSSVRTVETKINRDLPGSISKPT